MFLQAVKPELDSVVACCYTPKVLENNRLITIANAIDLVDTKDYDVYAWCVRNNWKGHLIDAYRKMYEGIHENISV